MHWLKYILWRYNYVIVVTSQTFSYHCVEYINLDSCVKFHDHRNNNNKVMIRGGMPPPPITDGSKKPMSNSVKDMKKDRKMVRKVRGLG